LVAVIGFAISANAEKEPVKNKDGKIVGYVICDIVNYQPHPSGGGFLTVDVYNDSDEYVNITIEGKGVSGSCYHSLYLGPYKKAEEKNKTFSCSEKPFGLKISVYRN
jgi:hypothetical protein